MMRAAEEKLLLMKQREEMAAMGMEQSFKKMKDGKSLLQPGLFCSHFFFYVLDENSSVFTAGNSSKAGAEKYWL